MRLRGQKVDMKMDFERITNNENVEERKKFNIGLRHIIDVIKICRVEDSVYCYVRFFTEFSSHLYIISTEIDPGIDVWYYLNNDLTVESSYLEGFKPEFKPETAYEQWNTVVNDLIDKAVAKAKPHKLKKHGSVRTKKMLQSNHD